MKKGILTSRVLRAGENLAPLEGVVGKISRNLHDVQRAVDEIDTQNIETCEAYNLFDHCGLKPVRKAIEEAVLKIPMYQ